MENKRDALGCFCPFDQEVGDCCNCDDIYKQMKNGNELDSEHHISFADFSAIEARTVAWASETFWQRIWRRIKEAW